MPLDCARRWREDPRMRWLLVATGVAAAAGVGRVAPAFPPASGVGGWDVLRFWSGPKEIAQRLKSAYGANADPKCETTNMFANDPVLSHTFSCSWDTEDDRLRVFGLKPTDVDFSYLDNRLYSVTFNFKPDPQHVLLDCEELRAYLLEGFGRPSLDDLRHGSGVQIHSTYWNKEETEVRLTCMWRRDFERVPLAPLSLDFSDTTLTNAMETKSRALKAATK